MPCPWYKNGYCTSPKVGTPSTSVVSKERCLGGSEAYSSCSFYVEPKKGTSPVLEALKPAVAQQLKPYPPIHLVSKPINCNCPFMKVHGYAGGYLAYCSVLGRLLTKHEVAVCEKYWRTCPLYRQAASSAVE